MMTPTERFGRDSMDKKCSAIQEYCEACRRQVGVTDKKVVSDYDLHEQHLKQQDLLLEIIQEQSKPQLGREILANAIGNAVYDATIWGIKGFLKFH